MPMKTWLIPTAVVAALAAAPALATDRLAQVSPPQPQQQQGLPDTTTGPPARGHGVPAVPPSQQTPGTSGQPAQVLPPQPSSPPPQHPPSQPKG